MASPGDRPKLPPRPTGVAISKRQPPSEMTAIGVSGGRVEKSIVAGINYGTISMEGGQSSRGFPGTLSQEILKRRLAEARKIFVPTQSFQQVQEKLERHGQVTLCGASGEGKTTMSLMLADKYIKKGFETVFVEKVDAFHFNECISSAGRLLLIVDDIFGTVGLSTDVTHLRNLLNSLKDCIAHCKEGSKTNPREKHINRGEEDSEEDKEDIIDIRVVFTSKTYNFQDGMSKLEYERLSMFSADKVVDFTTNNNYRYSNEERIAIFEKHKEMNPAVAVDEVSRHDIVDFRTALFGFPLTCRLFFEFAEFRGSTKDFFNRPLFYLRIEINKILNENNSQTAALILMLLCEDNLVLSELELQDGNQTMDERMKLVMDVVPSATRSGIAKAARNFRGTFFTGGDILQFAHSSIHDACAFAMFNFNPSFVLKFCSFDFFYERLKPESVEKTNVTNNLHFLFVSDIYHDLIARRLAGAIKQGYFTKTVTHPILQNEKFVRLLIEKLKTDSGSDIRSSTHWIKQKDKQKGFLYWAVQGPSNTLVEETEKQLKTAFTQSEITEALEGSVQTDNLTQVKLLLDKLETGSLPSTLNEMLLLSAEYGSWELDRYLLERGAIISAANIKIQSYVHLLCKFGKSNKLEKLKTEAVVPQSEIKRSSESIDTSGRSAIMLAAWTGSWPCFQLLSADSDMYKKSFNGNSLIHYAVLGGNMDIVQRVLTQTNINQRGWNGRTPVMFAAVGGHLTIFNYLVSKNADLTLVDDEGNSCIHLACAGGNKGIVQIVLTPSNKNTRGPKGQLPIMRAAAGGHLDVFDFLKEEGADLTLLADDGSNLLHFACIGGNKEIVEILLTPSNINSKDKRGFTPVMIAVGKGHKSVFDYLVSNNADLTVDIGCSLLYLACFGGNADIIRTILTHSDINEGDTDGTTPIMVSAGLGKQSVFFCLLENNADITLIMTNGNNLLHAACGGSISRGGCNKAILQYLLTVFDINCRGEHGLTPLMMTARKGHPGAFKFLLSNNADIKLEDDYGDNVLHLACAGGNIAIVGSLLTLFPIDSRGENGCTPVMFAAYYGHMHVVDFLVKKKADLTLVDDHGCDIVTMAEVGGNTKLVAYLQKLLRH